MDRKSQTRCAEGMCEVETASNKGSPFTVNAVRVRGIDLWGVLPERCDIVRTHMLVQTQGQNWAVLREESRRIPTYSIA